MPKVEKQEDELEQAIKNLVNVIRLSTRDMDRVVAKAIPHELNEPTQHFIKANIEFLSALNKFLSKRIEGLERTKKALEEKAEKRKVKREEVIID